MNDVIIKRRPMIDLDEFERRLGRPCSTDQRDGDPLAELLRIIGDKDEPHKTDLEPETQLSAITAGYRGTGRVQAACCASAPGRRQFRCDRGRVARHEAT